MDVLCLTGEGAKGLFQFGSALWLQRTGLNPKAYCGISSGALVAFLLSNVERTAAIKAVRDIKKRSDIFSLNWRHLFIGGLYTSKPLEDKITSLLEHSRLDETSRKPCWIAITNLETAQSHYEDVSQLDADRAKMLVLGACSIPGMVVPHKWPIVDAGTQEINPIGFAEKTYPNSVIHLLMARRLELQHFRLPMNPLMRTPMIASRALEVMMHALCMDNLDCLADGTRLMLYMPTVSLGSALSFDRMRNYLSDGNSGKLSTTLLVG